MDAHHAQLRMLELGLLETAARLEVRPGPVACRWCTDVWNTLADLALGCHCEEAAAALLAGARRWLDTVDAS